MLLSIREASQTYKVGQSTLRSWIAEGKLPWSHEPRQQRRVIVLNSEDIEQAIEDARNRTTGSISEKRAQDRKISELSRRVEDLEAYMGNIIDSLNVLINKIDEHIITKP